MTRDVSKSRNTSDARDMCQAHDNYVDMYVIAFRQQQQQQRHAVYVIRTLIVYSLAVLAAATEGVTSAAAHRARQQRALVVIVENARFLLSLGHHFAAISGEQAHGVSCCCTGDAMTAAVEPDRTVRFVRAKCTDVLFAVTDQLDVILLSLISSM